MNKSKHFTVTCPYCGRKFLTPYDWRYESYLQFCPECEVDFEVTEELIEEGEEWAIQQNSMDSAFTMP